MVFVRSLQSRQDFDKLINETQDQLVIVDFTAPWCGPCQAMKPVYAELSKQYRHVVFSTLDIDQVKDVAQACSISSIPTFHFYKNKQKVAEMKGANQQQLLTLLQQHQGAPTDSAANSVIPVGHMDLTEFVEMNQVECLNQSTEHVVQNIFKSDDSYLESDVDEQLIIKISFSQVVKVHTLLLVLNDREHAPSSVATFVNREIMLTFDEAEAIQPVEEIVLAADKSKESDGKAVEGTAQSSPEGERLLLRYVKYQNVYSLTLFINGNQGNMDTTIIKQLRIFGTPVETTKMKDLKKIGGDHDH